MPCPARNARPRPTPADRAAEPARKQLSTNTVQPVGHEHVRASVSLCCAGTATCAAAAVRLRAMPPEFKTAKQARRSVLTSGTGQPVSTYSAKEPRSFTEKFAKHANRRRKGERKARSRRGSG